MAVQHDVQTIAYPAPGARPRKGSDIITPHVIVLFGATGDLARSKLWPALHDLAASGRLPEELSVLGISRSSSTEELRERLGVSSFLVGGLDELGPVVERLAGT